MQKQPGYQRGAWHHPDLAMPASITQAGPSHRPQSVRHCVVATRAEHIHAGHHVFSVSPVTQFRSLWRSGHMERVQKAGTIEAPELHGLIDTADAVPFVDESGLGPTRYRLRSAWILLCMSTMRRQVMQ